MSKSTQQTGTMQHRLGQHYSKEIELVAPYDDVLLTVAPNYKVVDPFCGEGHLLFYYLDLFSPAEQLRLVESKQVLFYDLYEKNIDYVKSELSHRYNLSSDLLSEICKVNDSLLNPPSDPNFFIITNPPYLAKNVCKKSYPEDFAKYFDSAKENDYFEIALKLYSAYPGVWIVPANLLSSDLMLSLRKKLINHLSTIFIYQKKTFESTDISVCTFYLNPKISENKKDINFINDKKSEVSFVISESGNLVEEWDIIKSIPNALNVSQGYQDAKIEQGENCVVLLDTEYKKKEFFISDSHLSLLKSNVLILRTTDTGTSGGELGLYTLEEIWGDDAKDALSLVTKVSSRIYTPIFIPEMSVEEQLSLAKKFNAKLSKLRKKYYSIFLTNYKNSSQGTQRKRISFKEAYSLINYINGN